MKRILLALLLAIVPAFPKAEPDRVASARLRSLSNDAMDDAVERSERESDRVRCDRAAGSGGPAPGTGFGCFVEFDGCNGRRYEVDCSADDGLPACVCAVDGQVQSSFRVTDGICPRSGTPADLRRINANCGWKLAF